MTQTIDCSTHFYALENNFSGNTLSICEKPKDITPTRITGRVQETLKELNGFFSSLEHSSLRLYSSDVAVLSHFLKDLTNQIEQHIYRTYCTYLAFLVVLIQKLWPWGCLYALHSLEMKTKDLLDEKAICRLRVDPLNTIEPPAESSAEIERILRKAQRGALTQKEKKDFLPHLEKLSLEDRAPIFQVFQPFMQKKISPACAQLIYDAFSHLSQNRTLEERCKDTFNSLQKIVKQVKFLTSTKFEKKPMHLQAVLRTSFFIEVSIHRACKVQALANTFFTKEAAFLPRSLQYDQNSREVYVIADNQNALLKDNGSFKNATNALALSYDANTPPRRVVQLLTRVDSSEEELKKHLQAVRKEIAFLQRVQHIDGIMRLFSTTEFQQRVKYKAKEYDATRTSMIVEWCNSDLYGAVLKDKRKFTIKTQLRIAAKLAKIVSDLHKENIIHADLKLQNTLLQLHEGSTDINDSFKDIRVCDFGMTFSLSEKEEKDIRKPSRYYLAGYYGTCTMTAPEHLGVKKFSKDHRKIESWVLGTMLYQIHFRDSPSWHALIDTEDSENFSNHHDCFRDKKRLKKFRKTLSSEIEKKVQKPLLKLTKKKKLTLDLQFRKLIFEALQEEPVKRPSVPEITSRLSALLESASSH